MSKILKKENLKPLLVLGIICILVALILAAINMVTGPIIKKMEEQKIYDSLREALDGEFAPVEIPAGAPDTVTGVYKVTENGEAVGHVVTVEKQGYASTIVLTVGIKADGTVNRVVVTSQQETHQKDISSLINGFAGVNEEGVADVEQVTGATITSKTIKEAVADAFKALSADAGDNGGEEEEETLPRTDAEIEALAKEMVSGEITLTNLELTDAPSALKRIYDAGDNGYFLYVVVPGAYVPVATEALINVDNEGKIVKTNLLSWVVGHGVEPGNFADGFNGKDKDSVGSVDLVTQATGTSQDFRNAVEQSLAYLADNYGTEEQLPKTDEEIKNIANEMVDGDIILSIVEIKNAPTALKRVFNAGDDGYFLYVVVPGEWVPVATEAVVHVSNSGKIVKTNLLSWVVGHGVEPGDFADRFAGADTNSVGQVELVSEATGTSSDFRNAVEEALTYAVDTFDLKEDLPTSEEEIKSIASEMAGKQLTLSDFVVNNAPDTLKKVYTAGDDGYILYIVVPGEWVPVATEAIVYLNKNCEIVKINLLSWVVGHGVEPGDFADRFAGTDKNSVGQVELVSEATGTSSDFRTALEAAVIIVADGDMAKETMLVKKMQNIVPNAEGFTKMEIPGGADSTLKALYKVEGFDGYVAYVITSTKYVDVETEALVYINSKREVANIDLMTWTVGHGIEPGDFANSLIGKNAKELADAELVTAATVTSGNLRDAIVSALDVIPVDYTPVIIGVVVLVLTLSSIVAIIITKRRKNG